MAPGQEIRNGHDNRRNLVIAEIASPSRVIEKQAFTADRRESLVRL
jgi:hypothetical protein